MLLRAVVEVPLDPASLVVCGMDDARAGRGELDGLPPELGERLAKRRVEPRVVDQRREAMAQLADDPRQVRLEPAVRKRARPPLERDEADEAACMRDRSRQIG